MPYLKHTALIAKKLGLNFGEEDIEVMLRLLENGVTPDNLVMMLEDIKKEAENRNAADYAKGQ